MEFFSKLQSMGITNAEIKIMEKNGRMSVSFIPKYKEGLSELSKIKPVVISGPAAALDEKFFENITVFTDNDEFRTNLEAAKKSVDEASKALADKANKPKDTAGKRTKKSAADSEDGAEEKADAPKPPKAEKPEKPKPPSKFQKYEDPILEMVQAEGFEINDENYTSLKDKVDMLSVMDRTSELAKEWEAKLKQYKAEKSSLFAGTDKPSSEPTKENSAPAAPPAPDIMDDDDDDDLPYHKFDDAIVE